VKAPLASRDDFTAAKGRHRAEWLHSCSHVEGAVTPGHRSPIELLQPDKRQLRESGSHAHRTEPCASSCPAPDRTGPARSPCRQLDRELGDVAATKAVVRIDCDRWRLMGGSTSEQRMRVG
jgi:hypothetical protein